MAADSLVADLRSMSVPELRAYVAGVLSARMVDEWGLAELLDELRLICDRLEWISTSIVLAGMDDRHVTFGGLQSTNPPTFIA